jgi:hypothetical protein
VDAFVPLNSSRECENGTKWTDEKINRQIQARNGKVDVQPWSRTMWLLFPGSAAKFLNALTISFAFMVKSEEVEEGKYDPAVSRRYEGGYNAHENVLTAVNYALQ